MTLALPGFTHRSSPLARSTRATVPSASELSRKKAADAPSRLTAWGLTVRARQETRARPCPSCRRSVP
ncbi:MAG: hypothetical protein SF051_13975 [Elusimicrobiota bacterium]|nr:hypothetical protein [Elusimicrobiota bacterium]